MFCNLQTKRAVAHVCRCYRYRIQNNRCWYEGAPQRDRSQQPQRGRSLVLSLRLVRLSVQSYSRVHEQVWLVSSHTRHKMQRATDVLYEEVMVEEQVSQTRDWVMTLASPATILFSFISEWAPTLTRTFSLFLMLICLTATCFFLFLQERPT